jgi:hypothetical protein
MLPNKRQQSFSRCLVILCGFAPLREPFFSPISASSASMREVFPTGTRAFCLARQENFAGRSDFSGSFG